VTNYTAKSSIKIYHIYHYNRILLYACETWKVSQRITNTLQGFINCCLQCIINIRWQEIILNEDLCKIRNQEPIAIQIKGRKWRWIGHTLRKPTRSIEKFILDWNPQGAQRSGRPKKTWKRTTEEKAMEMGKT
jgi:hypothetical protein